MAVAVAGPVPEPLTYRVPVSLQPAPQPGSRVLVPLGPRTVTGFVVDGPQTPPEAELRDVVRVLDPSPLLGPELLQLTRWVAGYYGCAWGEVLAAATPGGFTPASVRRLRLVGPLNDTAREALRNRAPVQAALVGALGEGRAVSLSHLRRLLRRRRLDGAIRSLLAAGVIEEVVEQPSVGPLDHGVRVATLVAAAGSRGQMRGPKQRALLNALEEAGGEAAVTALLEAADSSEAPLRALVKRGAVRLTRVPEPPGMEHYTVPGSAAPQELTLAQETVSGRIRQVLDQRTFSTLLLHGVTGSGKTAVYLQAIGAVLAQGRSAIFLAPEIALTSQLAGVVRARFGEVVTLLHSGMTPAERAAAWRALGGGGPVVVVGPRSAVFAPVGALGLIVVDEEQDGSYKQGAPDPKYNARDVAAVRARDAGAVLLLGSATPSLETFRRSQEERVERLELPERVDGRPLPEVVVMDMRAERRRGNRGLLSERLRTALVEHLGRGEQAIVLQNRRGYCPALTCIDCGWAQNCAHCQVRLVYHRSLLRLICHYCGYTQRPPAVCPLCQGRELVFRGAGTERVMEALREAVPEARAVRMDVDTTRRTGAHARILRAFAAGEYDILLGTQMVAKGLDFPEVTLVGVVDADVGLHLPDFRAGEHTFQLLIQVAGRAGRGEVPGAVIVQTYRPEHPSIVAARTHDYLGFAKAELAFRRELSYPPFGRLVTLLLRGRDEAAVERAAMGVVRALGPALGGIGEVLGPSRAAIAKIRDRYRWRVLLKGSSTIRLVNAWRAVWPEVRSAVTGDGVDVDVDVDPFSLL